MATHEISMLNNNTGPDLNVWQGPYSILAANKVWQFLVWYFGPSADNAQPTARIGLRCRFSVPQNYVSGAKFIARHTSTKTSGNRVWDIDYRVVTGDDANSMDQAGVQESLTVTDAAPSAAHRKLDAQLTPTAGNFSPGAEVELELFVDGTDAADTIAGTQILFDALFQYSDT